MTIVDREAAHLFHTYKRIPLEIDRGEGVYLYAKGGKRYLDLFGGLAVNALGYGNARVLRAIEEQSRKYIHLSNYFLQEPQIALAEMLTGQSGYKRVFFTNSGTESIEGTIKLARKWGAANGKRELVAFSNAFHGRTMGALSLMDKQKYREGYGPFLPHCSTVEFNDIAALRRSVNGQTAAVLLEFIQGEGGIYPVSTEFARELDSLRKEFGFLIIADEIQAGLGRTGKFFGFEHFKINPDIVAIAKPLGGGLPVGAFLGSEKVAETLQPGVHGTTFGGNPVACAAGVAVLDQIVNGGLMANANAMGEIFRKELESLKSEYPALIKEVRVFGLMIGVELFREGEAIVNALRERGVLLNCTNANVLRFLPPLIIREPEVQEGLDRLREVLRSLG
jgi:acetylornithine aminotransferase